MVQVGASTPSRSLYEVRVFLRIDILLPAAHSDDSCMARTYPC